VPPAGAKRGIPRLAVVFFLAIALSLSLGFWWWNSRSAASAPELQKLIGRWQRPDGGYVLAIKSITDNGALDAGYFNPKSIHVANAEASRDGNVTKVFIELRDVNYPGSTYTLTYVPASDQLKGIYYQAVEKQRFPVVFVRVK
jgi:hypothetical protein